MPVSFNKNKHWTTAVVIKVAGTVPVHLKMHNSIDMNACSPLLCIECREQNWTTIAVIKVAWTVPAHPAQGA